MTYRHLKDTVALAPPGIHLALLDALLTAADVYARWGYPLVVTSLGDSQHTPHSLHYEGKAADLRVRHLPIHDRPAVVRELQHALGPQYDVLLEVDHIHLEYDPPTP
jgi:hypothetical protein